MRIRQLLSGLNGFLTFKPRAAMLPNFEVTLEGAPTEANVLGVKGVGQAGRIAAPQTIVAFGTRYRLKLYI